MVTRFHLWLRNIHVVNNRWRQSYQEVFLKNGNSGAAAGKEERAIET